MIADWFLSITGPFLTTTGALLIFLYLWRSPRFAEVWLTPQGQQAYAKHRRLLIFGVGLLALWIMLEYIAFVVS